MYAPAVANATQGAVRIGELARRTGVSPELLRAWESRYGVVQPSRSPGGFRLYSAEDERRVRTMIALIAGGLSASEAASQALSPRPGSTAVADARPLTEALAIELRSALDTFDGPRAHHAIDRLFDTVSIETVLTDVLVPYLQELGERWQRGEASVAQEHFASNLIRGRLLAVGRDWAASPGRPLVLASPPDEEHDLPLIMFGIAMSRRGARIVYLGADTPVETIRDAVTATDPDAVILSATLPERFRAVGPAIASLAHDVPVWICGRGADGSMAESLGARLLDGDPVEAADQLV
jgi:MerR family transcriptional regulator, light-induced transcriptional regulator